MILLAALAGLMVYLPIGFAALVEERREPASTSVAQLAHLAAVGFRPGDHRQWKRWGRHSG